MLLILSRTFSINSATFSSMVRPVSLIFIADIFGCNCCRIRSWCHSSIISWYQRFLWYLRSKSSWKDQQWFLWLKWASTIKCIFVTSSFSSFSSSDNSRIFSHFNNVLCLNSFQVWIYSYVNCLYVFVFWEPLLTQFALSPDFSQLQ